MSKTSVLMIGCGDLGQRLYQELHNDSYRCWGLRRDTAALPAGIQPVQGDYLKPASLSALAEIAPDFLVLTLKPSQYNAEGYWQGFVQGTRNVLAALDTRSLRRILVVSSTRVYAEFGGAWVDELGDVNSAHFASAALLAMEAELDACAPSTAVRCGGIYGDPDGMLIRRVLERRFSPLQPLRYSNRIHRDDVAAALAHLLRLAVHDAALESSYNVVDSEPAPQAEVERFIAAELGVPVPADLPIVEPGLGDAGHKRIRNERLLATGFELLYPDFRKGYRAVLREREPSG
jgi:nucleoside-diphosphate-sugar epimerase